jgi:hypothetical protein
MTTTRPQEHNQKTNTGDPHNLGSEIPAKQTAQYIADMLLELRNMAKSAGLKNLQGLLEVSYYEAFSGANRPPVPSGEVERLERMSADVRKAESDSPDRLEESITRPDR